jgi:hypothetical protein
MVCRHVQWDEDLSTIACYDKISSFEALNGVTSHLATDIYDSGRYDYFCFNRRSTYAGGSCNHQFSSARPE